MKVVFATGIYPPDIGGPATYVSQLAGELLSRGVEVGVITYGQRTGVEEGAYRVKRVARASPLPVRYLRFLGAVARSARGADLVYLQDAFSSGLPGLVGARLSGRPALLKVVGDPSWEIAREREIVCDDFEAYQTRKYTFSVEAMRRAQRLVARGADRVLVPSRFLARVVQAWGVPANRIEVVPNSVRETSAPPMSRQEAKQRVGLGTSTAILSVGRLVPWKGFETLIHLAADMRSRFADLRWVIAGEGPSEERLKSLAAELRVEDLVRFTGAVPRENLSLYFLACDVFVLWSGYEGLSHVLLEAMRAGMPVVASDAGGNPELIEDGLSGRLMPWRDRGGLRAALEDLCRDPDLRRRLGEKAKLRAEGLDWQSMVSRTIDVFERTLHTRRT